MNLEEEVRRGHTISTEMKTVWSIQIQMVQKLLDVCRRNDLKIWADGGTLLGVVREHGYIPWDDDIDMLMFRDDYDRLLSIASQEFKSPFFFQSYKTDKKYYRGHSQLRFDGTTCILPGEEFCDFHQGIFIDIFVYDSIPNVFDKEWERRIKKTEEIMAKLHDYSHCYPTLNPFHLWSLLCNSIYCILKNPTELYESCEDLFRKYNYEETERVYCGMFNRHLMDRAIKQKDWYSSTIYMQFEDIDLPVPIGFHHILSTQYGTDYMTPRKAPSFHGGFLKLDSEKSYKEYLPRLRKTYWIRRIKDILKKGRSKFLSFGKNTARK